MTGSFRMVGVTPLRGKQLVVHLVDEVTESQEQPDGSGATWELRITADEAPELLAQLQRAYSDMMQRALLEVAAGGCRRCLNRRQVANPDDDFHLVPCPVCVPRAEERIRSALFLRRAAE